MKKSISQTNDILKKRLKGIYLCSKQHRIPGYNLDYNDIEPYEGLTHCCDMRDVDLRNYDYIIATPPCNYYSRANYRRETSKVAQATKDLLPYILNKCLELNKPFLIENVLNSSLLPKTNRCYIFTFGQHTFYTNIFMFTPDKSYAVKQNKAKLPQGKRDNNYNVDLIIKIFLELVNLEI